MIDELHIKNNIIDLINNDFEINKLYIDYNEVIINDNNNIKEIYINDEKNYKNNKIILNNNIINKLYVKNSIIYFNNYKINELYYLNCDDKINNINDILINCNINYLKINNDDFINFNNNKINDINVKQSNLINIKTIKNINIDTFNLNRIFINNKMYINIENINKLYDDIYKNKIKKNDIIKNKNYNNCQIKLINKTVFSDCICINLIIENNIFNSINVKINENKCLNTISDACGCDVWTYEVEEDLYDIYLNE